MRLKLLLSIGLIGWMLSACSLDPKQDDPRLKTPAQFTPDARFVELSGPSPKPSAWWEGYGDPQLNQLEQGLQGNQDLLAQMQHIEQSRAYLAAQQGQLWPQADLAAGVSNQQLSRNRATYFPGFPYRYTDQSVALGLSWEPDVFGRLHDQERIAHSLLQADEDDLHALQLSLQGQLALSYMALIADQQTRPLLQEQLADSRRYAQLMHLTLDAGNAVITTVDAADSAVETVQAELAQIDADLALQEHALALLLGHNAGSYQAPHGAQLPSVQRPQVLPASVLARRPDVARQLHLLEAAKARIGLARSAYFPRFMLSAGAGLESGAPQELLDIPSQLWSLGASSLVTLFDGGQRRALNRQMQAAYDEQVAHYRQSGLNAIREAEDARSSLSAALAREDSLRRQVKLADEQADQARIAEREGMSSELERLQARIQARQLHILLIQRQAESLSADLHWLLAID